MRESARTRFHLRRGGHDGVEQLLAALGAGAVGVCGGGEAVGVGGQAAGSVAHDAGDLGLHHGLRAHRHALRPKEIGKGEGERGGG